MARRQQIDSFEDLIAVLVRRRHKLGLSQNATDELIGWTPTYLSKCEAYSGPQGRTVGVRNLIDWAQALGLELALLPRRERRLPQPSAGTDRVAA